MNVFLNTDNIPFHYVESEDGKSYSHDAGGRCLAESQATFLDHTLQGVLCYATLGKYAQHGVLADDVSEGTDDTLIILNQKANRDCRHFAE